jgi:succinyl-diaminopimelate desuccinylase
MTAQMDPVALARALLACQSVTPADGGAQGTLAEFLAEAGFTVSRMAFGEGATEVPNLYATIGRGSPHLVFCGHTDVVPPGDATRWSHPPFAAETAGGFLYGRGAVDMKGAVAAFAAAAINRARNSPLRGTLSLLITGDEEGAAINGTVKVIDWATADGIRFDAALVGEPTSQRRLGDTYKTGRRGSLSGTIRITGRQGHSAYPQRAENPIPPLVAVLDRLAKLELDAGSADFEASTLVLTSVDVGNPAFNVIPAAATARFNARFSDRWTPASLEALIRQEVAAAAGTSQVALAIEPGASNSFLTHPGALTNVLAAAVREVTGLVPAPSTGGGTSDARFFRDVCPVVEFGLVGETMHQVDERVAVADLRALTAIYAAFLNRYFAAAT